MEAEMLARCGWARSEPCQSYHDNEWGIPIRDDQLLFEMLTLEGAQAGLSWETVLKKREGYREAFLGFEIPAVALMTETEAEALMSFGGIIRNRAKITSTIRNARCILEMQEQGLIFSEFIWSFVNGEPVINLPLSLSDVPSQTETSVSMSKELLKKGFKFVGPTICYAFMQAAGLVNDHTQDCFRSKHA